jgi:hypothetical protein
MADSHKDVMELAPAVLPGADQVLLELLRIESDRLCVMIGQCPATSNQCFGFFHGDLEGAVLAMCRG